MSSSTTTLYVVPKLAPDYHVIKDYPKRLENFKNGLDKPYSWTMKKEHQAYYKGELQKFDIMFFDTENREGEVRTCLVLFWLIEAQEKEVITEAHKRRLVNTLYTTNDFFGSNFDVGFGENTDAFDEKGELRKSSGRTVEQGVFCEDKIAVCNFHINYDGPGPIMQILMTSKFTSGDMLMDILGDKADPFPVQDPTLSKEELKQYKASKLEHARKQLSKLGEKHDIVKMVLEFNEKNLSLPPNLDPKRYQEAGKNQPMGPECIADWTKAAPLCILLRFLSWLEKNPLNAQLLAILASSESAQYEITPHDANYGVIPPNKNRLDWIKEEEGTTWAFLHLFPIYEENQTKFVKEFKFLLDNSKLCWGDEDKEHYDTSAFSLMTEGIMNSEARLGKIKRIAANIMLGNIHISPGFQKKVDEFLGPFGIDTEFRIPKFELVSTVEDSYTTIQRIGTRVIVNPSGRSLSA
jgi:hypothetical protein